MRGIEAACIGRLRKDAEIRTSQSGLQWLAMPLIVGEDDDAQYISASSFSGSLAELASELKAGTEVYVEGKVKARVWERPGEAPIASLWLTARIVQPLGLIGNKRPKKPRKPKAAKTDPNAPLPFSDSLDDI